MMSRFYISMAGIAVIVLLIGTLLSGDQISMGHFTATPWPLIVSAGAALLVIIAFTIPLVPFSESSSIEIVATPGRVWDSLVDKSSYATWHPEVRSVTVVYSGAGLAKVRQREVLSRGIVFESTILEAVPPLRMVVLVAGIGVRSVNRTTLTPTAGRTLVERTAAMRLSLLAAAIRWVRRHHFSARRDALMLRIKQDIEAAAPRD